MIFFLMLAFNWAHADCRPAQMASYIVIPDQLESAPRVLMDPQVAYAALCEVEDDHAQDFAQSRVVLHSQNLLLDHMFDRGLVSRASYEYHKGYFGGLKANLNACDERSESLREFPGFRPRAHTHVVEFRSNGLMDLYPLNPDGTVNYQRRTTSHQNFYGWLISDEGLDLCEVKIHPAQ